MNPLSRENILECFQELSTEMGKDNLKGEILVFGGAAMVLAFNARPSTRDVDALFQPKSKIYELSKKIAERRNLPPDWLNDSVKGFIRTDTFKYRLLHRFDNLSVFVPEPEYLLAMKCISMRLGVESSDVEDVKYLIDHLKLTTADAIFDIIKKYYPQEQIPAKTYYAIEEILQQILEKK